MESLTYDCKKSTLSDDDAPIKKIVELTRHNFEIGLYSIVFVNCQC